MEIVWSLFQGFYDSLVEDLNLNTRNEFVSATLERIHSNVQKRCFTRDTFRRRFPLDENTIELCRDNLNRIIELLRQTDEERNSFLKIFPTWEKCRKNNIDQLKKIAGELHTESKSMNVARIVSSSVGIAGGAAIVGSLLFPPAAIAAWLAIGGGVATATSGVSGIGTAAVEWVLLKSHMDDAKAIIDADVEQFHGMMKWFRHSHDFIQAIEKVFFFGIFQSIFQDFEAFFQKAQTLFEKHQYSSMDRELGLIFDKICKMEISLLLTPELVIAVVGVLLVIFLVHRRYRFFFSVIEATVKVSLVFRVADAGLDAASGATAIVSKGTISGVKSAPRVLLGALAGIGIALDAATIVVSSIDMANGSVNEHGKKLDEAVQKLTEELELLREVQSNLLNPIEHEDQQNNASDHTVTRRNSI